MVTVLRVNGIFSFYKLQTNQMYHLRDGLLDIMRVLFFFSHRHLFLIRHKPLFLVHTQTNVFYPLYIHGSQQVSVETYYQTVCG